jgi:hypothetical protein
VRSSRKWNLYEKGKFTSTSVSEKGGGGLEARGSVKQYTHALSLSHTNILPHHSSFQYTTHSLTHSLNKYTYLHLHNTHHKRTLQGEPSCCCDDAYDCTGGSSQRNRCASRRYVERAGAAGFLEIEVSSRHHGRSAHGIQAGNRSGVACHPRTCVRINHRESGVSHLGGIDVNE